MGVAWVASGVLGFVLGVAAALREGRLLDRFVRGYCFVLAASPTFWVGLLLLIVFSVWLGWFPLGFSVPVGVAAADVTFADALHTMALRPSRYRWWGWPTWRCTPGPRPSMC